MHSRRAVHGPLLAIASTGSLLTAALLAQPASAAGPRMPHVVPPACTAAQIVAWLQGPGNGAAGSIFYQLEFTNISNQTCTLFGYPGVSGVSIGSRQLGRPASRDAAHTPRVVTLAGVRRAAGQGVIGIGGSATAVLRIVDADNFPSAVCGRAAAAALRVYAPGQKLAKTIPFPFIACSRTGPTYLSVQAVQGGTRSQ